MRTVARPDFLVVALLGWAAVEPWGLGLDDAPQETAWGVAVAIPLLARRAVPGAAAAATLATTALQRTLGAGAAPLHASTAAALVAGYELGGVAVRSRLTGFGGAAAFVLAALALAAVGAGGWETASVQAQVTAVGVVLGGFAIGFFPPHRAAWAAALRAEVAALERELAAELRAAATAERAAIARQLEQLVAQVRRALPPRTVEDNAARMAIALQRTEQAARATSAELRRLLDVLQAHDAIVAPREPLVARVVRFQTQYGPVVAFAVIGVVDQLLLPARPAEVAPGIAVPEAPYPPAVAVALALATALPLLLRERAPLAAIGGVAVLLVARSATGDLSSLTWSQNALGVGLAFAAGAFGDGRARSRAGLAIAATATAATWALEQMPVTPFEWVYLAALLGAAWFAGRRMRPHVAAAARGDDRVAELRARRAGLVREAAALERRHVAREVHDLVGHGLSLMSMHAAVGAARLETGVEPVADAVHRIRGLAADTERELGLLLGSLRAPRADGATGVTDLRALEELVGEARRSGQPVAIHGGDLEVPPHVARVVTDVVREGLTNARKHAGAAPVRVAVRAGDGLVRLEVVNQRGTPLVDAGSRRGLSGLRERVEGAGGRLEAGPTTAGGWRLGCVLPRTWQPPTEERYAPRRCR